MLGPPPRRRRRLVLVEEARAASGELCLVQLERSSGGLAPRGAGAQPPRAPSRDGRRAHSGSTSPYMGDPPRG
eukprot:8112074-Alexandrium_andersonii.AAC.1